ncbi:MAG: hypothetical protein ACXW13_12465, partial [Burkholderiaceae bacterium]
MLNSPDVAPFLGRRPEGRPAPSNIALGAVLLDSGKEKTSQIEAMSRQQRLALPLPDLTVAS